MILIICPSKRLARSTSEAFHYMSILSYGATPSEGLSEISSMYRAALIIKPELFPDIRDYIARLRSYNKDLPIFALTDSDNPSGFSNLFETTYSKTTMTPMLASSIVSYANEHNYANIGSYNIGGFHASCNQFGVKYFDTYVNLTKTEAMILRYLAVSYPIPQSSESIIKYAFKPSKRPENASIRTHISVMNKKIEKTIGRRLIIHVQNEGYLVLTPEYLHSQNVYK